MVGALFATYYVLSRAAPNELVANDMRALVLGGLCSAWEAGPRSAAELKEAATHYDRAAALHPAPAGQTLYTVGAGWCRSQAEAKPCSGVTKGESAFELDTPYGLIINNYIRITIPIVGHGHTAPHATGTHSARASCT